jgi:hypothetical protein
MASQALAKYSRAHVVSGAFKNVLASKVRLTVNDRSCLQDAVTFKVAEASYGVEKSFSELCPLCVVMIIYACVPLTRHTIRPSSRHSVSGSIFAMAALLTGNSGKLNPNILGGVNVSEGYFTPYSKADASAVELLSNRMSTSYRLRHLPTIDNFIRMPIAGASCEDAVFLFVFCRYKTDESYSFSRVVA